MRAALIVVLMAGMSSSVLLENARPPLHFAHQQLKLTCS